MNLFCLILLIDVIIPTDLVFGDIFTSTEHMSQLLDIENILIFTLNQYILQHHEKLTYLNERLTEYSLEESRKKTKKSVKINNLLISRLFIYKRLVHGWNNTIQFSREGTKLSLLYLTSNIKVIRNNWQYPTEEDFSGVVLGLERLQRFYKLQTSDLANGQIRNVKFLRSKMSASDCYHMGVELFKKQKYYYAEQWFNEALSRTNSNKAVTLNILNYLVECYAEQAEYVHALEVTNKILEILPNDLNALDDKLSFNELIKAKHKSHFEYYLAQNQKIKEMIIKIDDPMNYTNPWMYDDYQRKLFEALCRNDTKDSPKKMAPLRCKYNMNKSPFLLIAPLKYEEISLDPYIVLYHNVIYDNEIEVIKNLATFRLRRAAVQLFPNSTKSQPANYRISKSTVFSEHDHPYFANINKRSSDMTGLTTKFYDKFHVANYGIGGFYDSHFDFALKNDLTFEKLELGNRIATILFYYSDVIEGGATAFPLIKKVVFPKKGSALVWYNLFASGEGDPRTKHAGCPVLVGSKWVSNKWFHQRHQEYLRPCNLYPDHICNSYE